MHNCLTVLAHLGPHDSLHGFAAGFAHPWLGLDHLLAMIAVGLLAVRASDHRAVLTVPAMFIGGLLVGGALAFLNVPIPGVEYAIAGCVILLGLAVAVRKNVALAPAMALVALAGMFHGYAHVAEMAGDALSYGLGMTLATALLHASGVAAGLIMLRFKSQLPVRVAGAAIAAAFGITLFPF